MTINRIYFDLTIYDYNAILQALEQYTHLARITLHRDGMQCYCEFLDCHYNPVLTIDEFSNFILELTVQKGEFCAFA